MMLTKAQNMLLGIAIGDAFGAGYEFLEGGRAAVEKELDFTRYRAHPNPEFSHRAGWYTDDTQMSIAVAELLLSNKNFEKNNLADYFVKCHKRDPVIGYSKRLQQALDDSNNGQEFLSIINNESKGNGAAMRAVPIGLVDDLDTLVEYAIINAETTHNTPEGIASSLFVSLASHYFVKGLDKRRKLLDFIHPYVQRVHQGAANHIYAVSKLKSEDLTILFGPGRENRGVPCDATKTIGAVFYIISNHGNDPREALRHAVLLGGDTDSVASISLGLLSINEGLNALPSWMLKNLTEHKYGKDYIMRLADKLAERFGIE
jgi:ADP-ribosyl-[dinitrogen reductase] hydrolase